jgi:hypothetical protein
VKLVRIFALTALATIGLAVSAQAMPLAPFGSHDSDVIRVWAGCGPGWHPNSWGRCVPNYSRGYYGRRYWRRY